MATPELDPVRVARFVTRVASSARLSGDGDVSRSLCTAAAAAVGVRGAAIVLISAGRNLGSSCSSDRGVETVEDAQYTTGEGPGIDACNKRAPVLVADLLDADPRWVEYRDRAHAAGLRAVFGFPLLVGTSCIGALDLLGDTAGDLSDEQYLDALAVAHVAGRTILGWQSVAGPGSVPWELEHVPAHRAVVHQAAGMVSVQAGVSVDDALVLVRAYAFAQDRPIRSVAGDVVEGRIRLA
jgi:hypothetical protein